MSRINVSEARGLLEAYNAVYAPQEITEEQIWEEVENWVNSLLEEGYDLSDYTWEEMYENYRDATTSVDRYASSVLRKPLPTFKSELQKAKLEKDIGKFLRGERPAAPAATRSGSAPAATRPAAPAATRPTAAPDKSKVAPTKPATGTLGKTSYEVRTPTSAELKAAQAARAGGASPEKALQAAKVAGTASKIQSAGQTAGAKAFSSPTSGASAFKPATIAAAPSTSPSTSGSVAPATAAIASTPKPTPVAPRQTARERVLNQSYEYDAYDLVLEYLLNNGHVETVDEAHYVMLEMEAEVIRDIVGEIVEQMSGGPTDSPIDKGGAKWNKGQKLSDPRAQKVYDKLTGTKLPPA